jgi:hypothetical protein
LTIAAAVAFVGATDEFRRFVVLRERDFDLGKEYKGLDMEDVLSFDASALVDTEANFLDVVESIVQ